MKTSTLLSSSPVLRPFGIGILLLLFLFPSISTTLASEKTAPHPRSLLQVAGIHDPAIDTRSSPQSPHAVCYDHHSPLQVTETITALGGSQWRYSYAFVNLEPFDIWHFILWTSFQTSSVTIFDGFPGTWTANSHDITTVYSGYDARNLDSSLSWVSQAWDSSWPDNPPNPIGKGMPVSGFSFVGNVLDRGPKWFGYERVGVWAPEDGCLTAVGLIDGVRRVNDLRVSPKSSAGEVELKWTAPADADSHAVAQYDLRYHSSPINESNWGSATPASGEPTPAAPGNDQALSLSGLATNTHWYFALKSIATSGDSSPLSNVPSFHDLGLRTNPDGYNFPNYGGNFPFDDYDYQYDSLIEMFGQEDVCWMVGSVCLVKPSADLWHFFANRSMNGGHCYGMAATSSRFFNHTDDPANFQAAAGSTHALAQANSRTNIAYHFVFQLTEPSAAQVEQVRQNSPSSIVDDLYTLPDPPILFVYRRDLRSGHAITPYAIEDQGNGTLRIYVYDNNHPNDNSRFVTVDRNANTWSYALSAITTWTGDDTSDTFGYVPISFNSQPPDCPWCDTTRLAPAAPGVTPTGQLWATAGQLLITNQIGQRIGYSGATFINEIPGAYAHPLLSGLQDAEPAYFIPLGDPYTVTLAGQALSSTENASVVQFGPGYAAAVREVNLSPASQDQITFAPDGTSISFLSSQAKQTTLTLALDLTGQSYAFEIRGADVATGKPISVQADLLDGRLVIDNSQGDDSTYTVQFTRVDQAGEITFLHHNITVSGSDTQYFSFDSWAGAEIELCTDVGSNGTTDDCQMLANDSWFIFIPTVSR